MDIYRFINSEVIRNYLKNEQENGRYRGFNTIEKAWLVNQCQDAAMEEKHLAWNEILANDPDTDFFTSGYFGMYYDSFHDALKKHICYEDKAVERFLQVPEENAYVYNFLQRDSEEPREIAYPFVFSDFQSGIDFIKSEGNVGCSYYICEKIPVGPDVEKAADEKSSVYIYGKKYSTVELSPDLEIRSIRTEHFEDDACRWLDFSALQVKFPTPFKTGDLLCIPDRKNGYISGPIMYDVLYDHESEFRDEGDDEAASPYEISWSHVAGHNPRKNGIHDKIDAGLQNVCNLMNCEYCEEEAVESIGELI